MNDDFLLQIKRDCSILLERALLHKTVAAYGIDGNGQYGTNDRAHFFKVQGIQVDLESSSDVMNLLGTASILLENYKVKQHGHIFTDNNLRISLNVLLHKQGIDPRCWSWSDLKSQGDSFFTVELNVPKLMGW
jgi:hypothetical protein